MEKKELYSTGEFAKKANVSIRTIHFYEKKGLIHPFKIAENGYRYYGEEEFARLQRILTLKMLGFSLEEIQALSLNEDDADYLHQSLMQQHSLVQRKITYLQSMEKALEEVADKLKREKKTDWKEITNLIRIANMNRELVEQYQNGTNINARIRLHHLYSQNPKSWFSWIYDQIEEVSMENVLEIGCGTGQFWKENIERIPEKANIFLTDISAGMLEDSRKNLCLGEEEKRFSFGIADACEIPAPDNSFDLVIANFVLFYINDMNKALSEIRRVLKQDGIFVCATYGAGHMAEIEDLVQAYQPKIHLSEIKLYDIFGLENGKNILSPFFQTIEKREYKDSLVVTKVSPLLDYIMSCHGNQREYLVKEYHRFVDFVEKKMKQKGKIEITKQAGIFLAKPRK